MDDTQLAQQLEKTGNLMDLLNDETWLKQHPAIEAEGDGYVEAGTGLQAYVQQLKAVSADAFREQQQQVRLLSILLPGLHEWLSSWELASSFEVVYAEAQRLLYQRLKLALDNQEQWIDEMLASLAAIEQRESAAAKDSQFNVKLRLALLLQQEDWQLLAQVAAQDVKQRILERAQTELDAPIAV